MKKKSKLIDILVACTLNLPLINGCIALPRISIILISFFSFVSLLFLIKKQLFFKGLFLTLIAYIYLLFLSSIFTEYYSSYTMEYWKFFSSFGLLNLFISTQNFNEEKVISHSINLGFYLLPLLLRLRFSSFTGPEMMGYAYAMLPIYLATIFSFNKKESFKKIQIITIFSVYSIILLLFAPRGIWLCVISFLLLHLYSKIKLLSNLKKHIIIFVATIAFAFCIMFNSFISYKVILSNIDSFFINTIGLRIYAIHKLVKLQQKDDVMHGRNDLWEVALKDFTNNPIVGIGIGSFEYISNGHHTHNILIQSLCERGVLSFVPILMLFFFITKQVFFNNNKQLFLILICSGFIPLFWSSVYWRLTTFWFLLGYIIKFCRLKTNT